MKTILITGGSGFVGTHLALRLRDKYRVVTTHFRHAQRIEGVTDYPLSVSQLDWMKELLSSVQPDVILYAAGKCQLSWTEAPTNTKALELVHVAGPSQLVSNSQVFGSRFIYLSSALVFDGARGNYHENDILIPSTALGKAKLAAENSIKSRALHYLILRSAPLLGRGPSHNPSMLDHWLHRWGHGHPVELDDLTRHSYVGIDGFTAWVERCVELSFSAAKNRVLHYGGLSRSTEYELGLEIARRLKIPATLVQRRPTGKASERLDYSLNTSATVKALEIQPLLLKQSLDLVEQSLLVP